MLWNSKVLQVGGFLPPPKDRKPQMLKSPGTARWPTRNKKKKADCCPSSSAAMKNGRIQTAMTTRNKKEDGDRMEVEMIMDDDPTRDRVTGRFAEKISEGLGWLQSRTEHTIGAFMGSVYKVNPAIADRGKERSGAAYFQTTEIEGQNQEIGNSRGQRSNSWPGKGGNGPTNYENGPNFAVG
ncbi:hypothetical protein Ancab_036082 [Ancistrocladus abbreviatus]